MALLFAFEIKDGIAALALAMAVVTFANSRLDRRAMNAIDIIQRLTTLETRVSLFWKMMETKAAEILHKPIHYERDALIEKYLDGCLSEEEMGCFVEMLQAISDDKENESEGARLSAAHLLAIIRVKKEVPDVLPRESTAHRFMRWLTRNVMRVTRG